MRAEQLQGLYNNRLTNTVGRALERTIQNLRTDGVDNSTPLQSGVCELGHGYLDAIL